MSCFFFKRIPRWPQSLYDTPRWGLPSATELYCSYEKWFAQSTGFKNENVPAVVCVVSTLCRLPPANSALHCEEREAFKRRVTHGFLCLSSITQIRTMLKAYVVRVQRCFSAQQTYTGRTSRLLSHDSDKVWSTEGDWWKPRPWTEGVDMHKLFNNGLKVW